MFTSYLRFTRVLTVAILATGFVASVHARPADPFWKPGAVAAATITASAPQRHLGAPFHGPRQTIPTRLSDVTPLQAAFTNDVARWVGPRDTVAVRK